MRSRFLPLLAITALLGGCAPGTSARWRASRDPVMHVRVLPAPTLADLPHRVLDTLVTSARTNATYMEPETRLRLAAAELGANALVILDTLRTDGNARVRAIAVRLEESYDDLRAQCLSGAGRVSSQVRLGACEQVIAREPDNADAWRQLAARRRGLWDHRGEREALEHVVRLASDDAVAHFELGRATRGRGTMEARLAAWRRAAALDSLYGAPRLALGMQLGERRETAAQALPWFDELARPEMRVERDEAAYWRGRALLQLERWSDAHAAFVAAADVDGRHSSYWGGAGYALSRAGRHAEALAMWDRALALESGYFSRMARQAPILDGERDAWKRSRAAVGRRE